ncbi:Type-2 restriction enzyme AplI [Nocardia farcinica]|uniref:BsuBI/PstI family type II restriction endonuclease n=1 Tax=Nocardia farcinica TaxID=37329 RepID=UPI000BF68EDC|nr:BsuBI/PstI family type II restriction endonuclease [Nocardia farcinica]PFW99119.1 Type-2 restriction enzyme AplI [Nocardia farcinica]PFX06743.1 Type-2 restriction enzyme AplI [Nocardia farcinica]
MTTDQNAQTIAEARQLLSDLGFDRERTNERSALVLLALLKLGPGDAWSNAANPMLGTRAIMDWISEQFDVQYAPNTRETVRRFTLHQFADALLIEQNPDQPDRPVNSPKWCYQVRANALKVIRAFGTPEYATLLLDHLIAVPGLKAQYDAAREMHRIPVNLPSGQPLTLSPGGQNVLIKQMVEDFCGYYTPGGEVLYVGDADAKWAVFEEAALAALGVTVDQHGKMPDLVVYLPAKNWLVLLEAASSHGPVDAKRHRELSELFQHSTAGLVFVSCFPSRVEMRKYLAEIAWETEVWCADNPTHLIHFNGERFLGPYEKTP